MYNAASQPDLHKLSSWHLLAVLSPLVAQIGPTADTPERALVKIPASE
jgi:hypothetical protein